MSETNRIEYKRELTSELDIEKEVVAFLNYKEGGYIYIGIDKDGTVIGVDDIDDCMLKLVESLGSGIPRILRAYGEDCFKFTDNFIRITLPVYEHASNHESAHESAHDNPHIHKPIKDLINCIEGELDRDTLQALIGIKHRTYFRTNYLKPAFEAGYIEFTHPDEKQSKLQKYRLTAKGLQLKETIKKQEKNKTKLG